MIQISHIATEGQVQGEAWPSLQCRRAKQVDVVLVSPKLRRVPSVTPCITYFALIFTVDWAGFRKTLISYRKRYNPHVVRLIRRKS